MLRKGKRRSQSEEEYNPLSSLANLSDVMFVFSVGLMVALMAASSGAPVSSSSYSDSGKQQQAVVDVEQGKELKEVPAIESDSAGSGFTEMGTVFKDPKTGKLIMIQPTDE